MSTERRLSFKQLKNSISSHNNSNIVKLRGFLGDDVSQVHENAY